jgi:CheY-like chemotaxis protein
MRSKQDLSNCGIIFSVYGLLSNFYPKMSKSGPIVLVEDDPDDQQLIHLIITSQGIENDVLFFDNGTEALEYLKSTADSPFIILCDVNMPKMNGIELCEAIQINEYLRKKSIPFVFFSTSAREQDVKHAYDLTVQGFFEKGVDYETLKRKLKLIFDYWFECAHPNNF